LLIIIFTVLTVGCSQGAGTNNNNSNNSDIVNLKVFTSSEGSMGQVLLSGISQIVNKNSDSLRISPQTSIGNEGYTFFENNVNERSTLLINGNQFTPSQAELGLLPFTKKTDDIPLGVFTYSPGAGFALLTKDENIKELKDLAGKKVDIGSPGSNTYNLYYPLFEAAGIADEIQLTPTESMGAGIQALGDGLVDVATSSIVLDAGPTPALAEILSKELYMVNVTDEIINKAKENIGLPFQGLTIKKDYFNEKYNTNYSFPNRDIKISVYSPGYFASESVPEEVIYDFVKLVIEHKDELSNYHSSGTLMAEHMSEFLFEEQLHPGAIRAYKEAGMKIGFE